MTAATIYDRIRRTPGLSLTDQAVLLALYRLAEPEPLTGRAICWHTRVTWDRLGQEAGIARSTLGRALQRLERAGFLQPHTGWRLQLDRLPGGAR